MPIPADLMRVTFVFDLLEDTSGPAVEQAQFNLSGRRSHVTGNTTNWADDVDGLAAGMRDRWQQNMPTAPFGNAVRANRVKAYHLDTSNHVLDEGVALFEGETTWAGAGTATMPWETSLCVSLYGYAASGFTRDAASKRGRFYLPPLTPSVLQGPAGRASGTNFTNLVTAIGVFLNDVQGAHIGSDGQAPGEESDYFDLSIISTTKNAVTPVDRWGVGDVFDEQRRRRRSQVEVRTYGDVAHA